jgi:hypothetical protein
MEHNGYKWIAFNHFTGEELYKRFIQSFDRLGLVQVAIEDKDHDGLFRGVQIVAQDVMDVLAEMFNDIVIIKGEAPQLELLEKKAPESAGNATSEA